MMMMMKNPVTLATCLLLFSSLSVLVKEISGSNSPTECCFGFYHNPPLPASRVASFRKTDHQCPKEGVLFTMKKGAEVCVDPSQQWVQDIINSKKKVQTKHVNNPTTSQQQPNTTPQAQQSRQ